MKDSRNEESSSRNGSYDPFKKSGINNENVNPNQKISRESFKKTNESFQLPKIKEENALQGTAGIQGNQNSEFEGKLEKINENVIIIQDETVDLRQMKKKQLKQLAKYYGYCCGKHTYNRNNIIEFLLDIRRKTILHQHDSSVLEAFLQS